MSALWCRWRGHDKRVIRFFSDDGITFMVSPWQCRRCKEILGGVVCVSTDICATCGHPEVWHRNDQTSATFCKDPDCPCRVYVPQPALDMAHVLNDRRLEWKP